MEDINKLKDKLIVSNKEYTEEELKKFDTIHRMHPIKEVSLPSSLLSHRICDITLLKVDAIVNPANEGGLGCFIKEHRCLDNVIHREAGPRLRQQCRQFMKGRTLKTPNIMVTQGFHLPATMIFHITGPVYKGVFYKDAIEKCYKSIIHLALNMGLKTVAIPCISTGLFGYPLQESAECAINVVQQCLKDPLAVIFCTYDEENTRIYRELLKST